MKIKTIILIFSLTVAGFFTACSEWTEPESLTIDNPSIETENAALYQQYLENLRNYKKTNHQIVIGWFDNREKIPNSRAVHLEALPDKVDIVTLLHGDDLAGFEIAEMEAIRRDKGTKTIYTVNYEAFRQDIEDRNAEIEQQNKDGQEAADAAGTTYVPIPLIDLAAELPEFIDRQLSLLDKYGYDGLSIHFVGKYILPDDERPAMQALQDVLFGKLQTVMNAHAGKLFIFEGAPQNVYNKELLQAFRYIVLRTEKITDMQILTETVQRTLSISGVPSGNLIVCASALSTDNTDTGTGNITAADGTTKNAITEIAHWVKTPDFFTKAGLGIYRINDDYYNAEQDYKFTREAIEIMNPSSKN
ncbi:MAG: glycoside hydrolase family 18 [Prevotellaceae bacterium]|jgi:hypothetical protein|nr:glycoside hydrolase family 18 [Prevotellaceae bacterium]